MYRYLCLYTCRCVSVSIDVSVFVFVTTLSANKAASWKLVHSRLYSFLLKKGKTKEFVKGRLAVLKNQYMAGEDVETSGKAQYQ